MQQREPHCPTLPGHLDEQHSYGLAVSAVLIPWGSLCEGISLAHNGAKTGRVGLCWGAGLCPSVALTGGDGS